MARQRRIRSVGHPLHLVQRGVDRSACFACEADFRLYLGLLEELAPLMGCAVHAYVLMTNHVHLLATPDEATLRKIREAIHGGYVLGSPGFIEEMAQVLGRRLARRNRTVAQTAGNSGSDPGLPLF